MSRGHGSLERYVLTTLMERECCSSAYLAESHPSANGWPTLSLRSSLNRTLARLERQGKIISGRPEGRVGWYISPLKKATAFHEASHAVVARALGVPIKYATIKPGVGTLGHVRFYNEFAKGTSHEDRVKRTLIDLAGALSENRLLGHPGRATRSGARADHRSVRYHLDILYGGWGEPKRLDRARPKRLTEELVLRYAAPIGRVARHLIERETLTGEQIDALVYSRA